MARKQNGALRHRPLSEHAVRVLRAIIDAVQDHRAPVALADALGRTPTRRDVEASMVLLSRWLIRASEGRVYHRQRAVELLALPDYRNRGLRPLT